MALTYENGNGNLNTAAFQLIGDGTTKTITVPLSLDPIDVRFTGTTSIGGGTATHPPSGLSGPPGVSVGGVFYTLSYTYDTVAFTVAVTIQNQSTGAALPSGTVAPVTVQFIYSGV